MSNLFKRGVQRIFRRCVRLYSSEFGVVIGSEPEKNSEYKVGVLY